MIGEHFGDRQLWKNLISLDSQSKVRAGETIGKTLRARQPEQRLDGVALGKLLGRNLRESRRVQHLESNRTVIHDAEISGEPSRILRAQLQHVRRLRKCAERCLHLDLDRELVLLRLIELHYE